MKNQKIECKPTRQISEEQRDQDRARLAASSEHARHSLPGRSDPPLTDPQPYESGEESYLAYVMREAR